MREIEGEERQGTCSLQFDCVLDEPANYRSMKGGCFGSVLGLDTLSKVLG